MTIPEYRIERQLMSNWCWAAVGSSISYYYAHFTESRTYWTQHHIAHAAYPNENCIDEPTNCNKLYELEKVLHGLGHLNHEYQLLTLNSIKTEIDLLRPLCCQIFFGARLSHFITIYGYEHKEVFIADPELGYYRIGYSQFVKKYRGGKWKRTYSTIQKPN